jgi:hypothetical protein
MSSQSPQTASITVYISSDASNPGYISFGMLGFLQGSMEPTGFPPVIANQAVAPGDTNSLMLQAYTDALYGGGVGIPDPIPSPLKGTATFYLPDGTSLDISWNLDAHTGGPMPLISAPAAWNVEGAGTPNVNGFNYTFNLTISPQ